MTAKQTSLTAISFVSLVVVLTVVWGVNQAIAEDNYSPEQGTQYDVSDPDVIIQDDDGDLVYEQDVIGNQVIEAEPVNTLGAYQWYWYEWPYGRHPFGYWAQQLRDEDVRREAEYANSNWGYSGPNHWGGQCKRFVQEVVRRASGGAVTIGSGYDFRGNFPYREENDVIRYARPGEYLQFTGALLHSTIIVYNYHDGRFMVVDSNWNLDEKINRHIIDARSGNANRAMMRSYLLGPR